MNELDHPARASFINRLKINRLHVRCGVTVRGQVLGHGAGSGLVLTWDDLTRQVILEDEKLVNKAAEAEGDQLV